MPSRKGLKALVLVCALVFVSRDVHAQDGDVVDVISDVYVDSLFGLFDSIPGGGDALGFDFNVEGAFFTSGVLSSALVTELAGFPIGSSSGGFTYFFDATSGAAVRSSPSFGPAFAERPLTSGRGKLNVGFTYLHRSFSQIEGLDLDDGSVKFNSLLFFGNTGGNVDLIESTFRMKVNSDTATFFATYGLMDKLDVAIAVPLQHVGVEASVTTQLVRFGPSSTALPVPAFVSSDSRDATGIGDVALRAKYNVFNGDRAAVAAGIDLRVPTGREEDLLGTGRTRTKLYAAIASKTARVFPHLNFGYTFESEEEDDALFFFGSEFSYTVGAEYVVNPRFTLVGDIIGRSLADEGRLKPQTRTEQLAVVTATNAGRVTVVPAEQRTVTELTFNPGLRLNSTVASIGAKFSPASTFIVSAHVLFPLSDAGLKSRATPVIGVDFTF